VLHGLFFFIAPGERVGVGAMTSPFLLDYPHPLTSRYSVGRTGSGKSTLTLALLRAVLTTGNVVFDGLPTANINLDALRSNIAFIPQVARCSFFVNG
jgi:ABC-type multidrug transport system fused ATPase/permease subunit